MPARDEERGFTLLELLLTVLIIGTLATLILPNYRRSVFKALAADVVTKVEAINVSIKDYEADHGDAPVGTGPAGSPPPWLAGYVQERYFNAANGITYQLVITSGSAAPTLVVNGGNDAGNIQIMLAAAGTLGNRASLSGGGSTMVVTLSN
jgi:prepilin-type N-terminal cleavage/methylation domain-containing protein